jgi:hypothetical protein
MNLGLFGFLGIPTGVEAVCNLARGIHGAADKLEADAPEIADFVREAAQTVEGLSNDLRERSLREIADSVSNFAKLEPVAFLGAAVLAGFVLARLSAQTAPGSPHSVTSTRHLAAIGNHRDASRAPSL